MYRKAIKHFHEPGHLHEFTFSCYHRMPLLTNDDWRAKLAYRLDEAGREESFDLVGFVFMPEHVHLLVFPTAEKLAIGRYLARIKQPFSKQIKEILIQRRSRLMETLTVRERPGKTCFHLWQEGPGFDRNIFSKEAIGASLDYIHNNPLKRGLCRNSVDWKWSSTRYYLEHPEAQQRAGLPFIHGLPVGALD